MEVKPGYKQTEVGIIPDDWDVKHLGDLGKVVRGGSPRPAGDPRYFNGDFIPWLTVASLTNIPDNKLFVTETASMLTREGSLHSRTLEEGLLVMVNSGARTLGVTKILSLTCCANDGIAALVGQREGERRFLCYYLNSQTKRLREVIAAGNDQLNLNTGRISLIPVPFPEAEEQRAIAEALSDVDELLSGLDRLISKKRDLKQASMQQLLTGQTRLPGFHGTLSRGTMTDLLDAQVTRSAPGGTETVTFLGMEDLSESGGMLRQHPLRLEGVKPGLTYFERNDTLVAKITPCFENGKGAFLGSLQTVSGFGSTEFHVLRARASGDPRYIYFQTRLPEFRRKLEGQMIGTAGQKRVPRAAILKYELPAIHEPDEQTAIADTLSEMEAELAALEQRREKTRALKQAMMQELLTGKTRLVKTETARA